MDYLMVIINICFPARFLACETVGHCDFSNKNVRDILPNAYVKFVIQALTGITSRPTVDEIEQTIMFTMVG
jgi:hypothetical protein